LPLSKRHVRQVAHQRHQPPRLPLRVRRIASGTLIVARVLHAREEQVKVALNRGERCTQFVAGQREELILEVAMLGGEGDIADDDDGVLRAVIAQRLPVGLEPAARPIRGRQAELQAKCLAPRGPCLRRLCPRERPALRVLRREGAAGTAGHARVGHVRAHGRPRPVDHQHGIADAGQDHRELRPLGL